MMYSVRDNKLARLLFIVFLPLVFFACGEEPVEAHHISEFSGHVGLDAVAEPESACLSSCRQGTETCEQNWLGAQEGLALCKASCMADVDGSAGWRDELETCYAGCDNYYAYARSYCYERESKFGLCTVEYDVCVTDCPE